MTEVKLDAPATTTRANIEQSRFWASEIGWALIQDPTDRNLDLLPDHFHIEFGCPECGAVWVELLAAGYTSRRVYGGSARWDGQEMAISVPAIEMLDFRAARISCFSGHAFNYDSYTGRLQRYTAPSWGAMALVGVGATIAAYVLGGVIAKGSL